MIELLFGGIAVLFSGLSSRYIFGGDSAEFSSIAHTWSIPHPPGYPLYSFLANCITYLIPFGTIPWRASLLSVIPTVLTAYLLYRILLRLKVRFFVSLLSSFFYLLLFPVWEYALVPEVFALNSLLVVSISYFLLLFREEGENRYILLSAFFVGLSVAHHHIFVIFIPGWYILIKDILPTIVKSKEILFRCLFLFICGLSFYLYAPIASIFQPPIQWEDSKTFLGFWRLITRAAYGSFTAYGGSKGDVLNQLYDVFSFFVFVLQDFRILGSLCILIGIWTTFRQRKNVFYSFMGVTTLIYIFFLFYTNFMLSSSFSIAMYERFLIAFYAILILYMGIGYDLLYSRILIFIYRLSNKKSIRFFARSCLILILALYIASVGKSNFAAISSIKEGKDFDRLGKDIVHTPPPGSIFFVGNDNAHFTTMYQIFEARIPTKARFFQINFMQREYYTNQFKKKNADLRYPSTFQSTKDVEAFVKLNKQRGVYFENPATYGMWMPYGLLWKYYETKDEALADLENIVKANTTLWDSIYHIPELNSSTKNILHLQTVQDLYMEAYITYAKLLYLAKDYKKSQEIVQDIITKYRPSNILVKATLLNLLTQEKKCVEAKVIAKQIAPDSHSINTLQAELVFSLTNYFANCDASNGVLKQLQMRSDLFKEKSLTPLDSF